MKCTTFCVMFAFCMLLGRAITKMKWHYWNGQSNNENVESKIPLGRISRESVIRNKEYLTRPRRPRMHSYYRPLVHLDRNPLSWVGRRGRYPDSGGWEGPRVLPNCILLRVKIGAMWTKWCSIFRSCNTYTSTVFPIHDQRKCAFKRSELHLTIATVLNLVDSWDSCILGCLYLRWLYISGITMIRDCSCVDRTLPGGLVFRSRLLTSASHWHLFGLNTVPTGQGITMPPNASMFL